MCPLGLFNDQTWQVAVATCNGNLSEGPFLSWSLYKMLSYPNFWCHLRYATDKFEYFGQKFRFMPPIGCDNTPMGCALYS